MTGISEQQRQTLIKEARSWLRWANQRGAIADEIRQFAEMVLRTLDADVAEASGGSTGLGNG